MKGPYDDIIDLPHYVSKTRKRMSMLDRAAQFSPFAALTGYDAAIRETGRLTDERIEFDVDGKAMLNDKLRMLAERHAQQPEITVIYFVPDERKHGGVYTEVTDRVGKIDGRRQLLFMADGREISFDDVYDIHSAIFGESRFDEHLCQNL